MQHVAHFPVACRGAVRAVHNPGGGVCNKLEALCMQLPDVHYLRSHNQLFVCVRGESAPQDLITAKGQQ